MQPKNTLFLCELLASLHFNIQLCCSVPYCSPVMKNHGSGLFLFVTTGGCGLASRLPCIGHTCPDILKHFIPLILLHWSSTLFPYWADTLWISTAFTPPVHKTNHSPLFFLGANWQQCSHIHSLIESDALRPRSPWVVFQHVTPWVSVLPTVSSLACSCGQCKKIVDAFWITFIWFSAATFCIY